MKYFLELTIPGLPKRTNNNTGSWRARHAEAKKWKKLVCDYIQPPMRPSQPLEKAKLTFVRYSSTQPDDDGLISSFKHVQDGLIAANVIANDAPKNIGTPSKTWGYAPRNCGYIMIRVESVA